MKELPDKSKLILTNAGFGVDEVSKEAIEQNKGILKAISKEQIKFRKPSYDELVEFIEMVADRRKVPEQLLTGSSNMTKGSRVNRFLKAEALKLLNKIK